MSADPNCAILLRHCPLSTTEDSLRQIFWNATKVMGPEKSVDDPHCDYYVLFTTPQEAYDALCLGTVNIEGEDIKIISLDPKNPSFLEDQMKTVFLGDLPESATKADIQMQFPEAEEVVLLPHQQCALVQLPTLEHAAKYIEAGYCHINGEAVIIADSSEGDQSAQRRANREIGLFGLPRDATVQELEAMFPNAQKVRINKHSSNASIKFWTPKGASLAMEQKPYHLRGQELRIDMPKVTNALKREDRKKRSVLLTGGLPGLTKEAILEAFPGATSIDMRKDKPRIIFMVLPSEEDVIQATALGTIEIKGQCLRIQSQVNPKEYKQQSKANAKLRTIVVGGCPPPTTKEDIAEHFPTAQSIRFTKPDSYNNRMAFVVMPTLEDADMAVTHQPTITVQGLELRLYRTQGEHDIDEENRTVVFTRCPHQTTDEDMFELFPNALNMRRSQDLSKPTCTYFLVFGTLEEARAASQCRAVTIHGEQVNLKLSTRGLQRAAHKRKLSYEEATSLPSISTPAEHHPLPQSSASYPSETLSSYEPEIAPTPYHIPKPYPRPVRPTAVPSSSFNYYQAHHLSALHHAVAIQVPGVAAKRRMRGGNSKVFHTAYQPTYLQPTQQHLHHDQWGPGYF